MSNEALAIYQEFLDVMADALIAGDAETFLSRIFLPCEVRTEGKTFHIADHATAPRYFHGFVEALRAQGVDSYIRIAREAVFHGPDRILGRHDALITSGGKLVTPRFENTMELERRGDTWGTSTIHHHMRFVAWPDILPRKDNR
jgi:hypothetical protein